MRQHQQRQANDDVSGSRQAGYRAWYHHGQSLQPVVEMATGSGDSEDDVGKADEEDDPSGRDRHPAPLLTPVRKTTVLALGSGLCGSRLCRSRPVRPLLRSGIRLCRSWPG